MSEKNIQEMYMIEQGLHNILIQKQAFQMELSETKEALKEVEKSGDETFKIIGQLMIKKSKDSIKNDLMNKERFLDLRIKSLEKQEASLSEQLEKVREESIKGKKH